MTGLMASHSCHSDNSGLPTCPLYRCGDAALRCGEGKAAGLQDSSWAAIAQRTAMSALWKSRRLALWVMFEDFPLYSTDCIGGKRLFQFLVVKMQVFQSFFHTLELQFSTLSKLASNYKSPISRLMKLKQIQIPNSTGKIGLSKSLDP